MLSTHGLTRRFGGLAAMQDVTLQIPDGEVRSVIGPNGAGKTTLLNLITGAIRPSAGRIELDGRDITGLAPSAIFRLGLVRSFQIALLFPKLTVRENVELMAYGRLRRSVLGRFGQRRLLEERTAHALDRVNMLDRAGREAGTLAHGDRRLVEIAMVLAAVPSVLLLDEPTAGMSPAETERTAVLLRALAPAITLVIVEHDMNVVMSISDKVLVLDHGRILAEGRPDEIRANAAVREVYLGPAGPGDLDAAP
jgi:branched-chain amino acid transport system ATP-binding protein